MSFPGVLWDTAPLWAAVVLFAVDMAVRLVALGVVPHNRRPSAAWGWLLVIFFLPVVGTVVFLVLGFADLPAARRRRQRHIAQEAGDGASAVPDDAAMPPWAAQTVQLNQHNGAFPPVGGNRIEILSDYDGALQAMAAAIRGARTSVHFEFFIAVADRSTEPIIAALEQAHGRGVEVRVLIDHLGSAAYPGYRQLVRRLDSAEIPWRRMLPVRPWRGEYQRPDLRNHRKILVIDAEVAFTGSMNVIDRSYNKPKNRKRGLQWVGLSLRLTGPAVQHLDAVFATDWACETGEEMLLRRPAGALRGSREEGVPCQVLPSGPGLPQESNLQLFNHLFATAHQRITLCAPYFVPDDSMLSTLRAAVGRGVEVRLYLGETASHALTHHAQRSFYEVLARAGIRIFLYPAPYVLHSKFVLIDDRAAVVGSSNLDIRSFALNHEINLLVTDAGFVARMDALVGQYHRAAHELELESWVDRPWHQKYLDNAARLTSAVQ